MSRATDVTVTNTVKCIDKLLFCVINDDGRLLITWVILHVPINIISLLIVVGLFLLFLWFVWTLFVAYFIEMLKEAL